MRYSPVGPAGTKEEFDRDWRVDKSFGNPTPYGYHEGLDINLKTGGDTDLGQELKAVANGRIVYYHYATHPTTNFGRHLVYKIDGAWGTRWVHYSHCLDTNFINNVQDVTEGQIIARLGKSGTSLAHLHWSIFKVDPVSIGGIDVIARTTSDLNNWWEDPFVFTQKWQVAIDPCADLRKQLDVVTAERDALRNKIEQAKVILA